MLTRLKIILIMLPMLISIGAIRQQNPQNKVQLAMERTFKEPVYLMEYEISGTCKIGNEWKKESYQFRLIKSDSSFRVDQGDVTTIYQNGLIVNVSRTDKVIIIQSKDDFNADMERNLLLNFFDSLPLLEQKPINGSTKFLIDTKNLGPDKLLKSGYIIISSDGWIKELHADIPENSFSEDTSPCNRFTVKFNKVTNQDVPTKEVSIDQFVSINNQQVKLKPKYASYELLSTLSPIEP